MRKQGNEDHSLLEAEDYYYYHPELQLEQSSISKVAGENGGSQANHWEKSCCLSLDIQYSQYMRTFTEHILCVRCSS